MTQHVLTDAEMHALISGNPFALGLSIARLKDFIRQVEKVVVAKQSVGQEPIAEIDCFGDTCCPVFGDRLQLKRGTKLYAHPMTCVASSSDKTACDSQNTKYATQTSGQVNLDNSNHIADMRKKVTPLAKRKIQSKIDEGEYRYLKGATVLVNEHGRAAIVNHGGAFYWVENADMYVEFHRAETQFEPDHIPDTSKMVKSLRDEFAMAALTGLLSNSGGPIQISSQSGWSLVNCTLDDVSSFAYEMADAMLAAAPKYTGDSNE